MIDDRVEGYVFAPQVPFGRLDVVGAMVALNEALKLTIHEGAMSQGGKDSRDLTLIFSSISSISEYCKVDNATFKLLKRNTPAAVTFILKSLSRIPDKVIAKRKTIGARIPDNAIARGLVELLGVPLLSTSLKSDVAEQEYFTDPELIHEMWGHEVDCVIDGGVGEDTPSTIVDLSEGEIEILRQGEVEIIL